MEGEEVLTVWASGAVAACTAPQAAVRVSWVGPSEPRRGHPAAVHTALVPMAATGKAMLLTATGQASAASGGSWAAQGGQGVPRQPDSTSSLVARPRASGSPGLPGVVSWQV